jgi:hypothetical protein
MKRLLIAVVFLLILPGCRKAEEQKPPAPLLEVQPEPPPRPSPEPPEPEVGPPEYRATVDPIPDEVRRKMQGISWRAGCPVPLEDLVFIKLRHWGYQDQVQDGELVVHRDVAGDVVEIFEDIFEARFPVEKIWLVDEYGGDDLESMRDNNTSAFNCRWKVPKPGVFSQHAYGTAIDINPLVNPYHSPKLILPKGGEKYIDRSVKAKGMILKGDVVYQAFVSRGWTWGGDWRRKKDYQHFEKKRDRSGQLIKPRGKK